jgi:hypothetical protein
LIEQPRLRGAFRQVVDRQQEMFLKLADKVGVFLAHVPADAIGFIAIKEKNPTVGS